MLNMNLFLVGFKENNVISTNAFVVDAMLWRNTPKFEHLSW